MIYPKNFAKFPRAQNLKVYSTVYVQDPFLHHSSLRYYSSHSLKVEVVDLPLKIGKCNTSRTLSTPRSSRRHQKRYSVQR